MDDDAQLIDLTPEQLREFVSKNKESDYLLVDVRQPGEYFVMHIPGATLIPLTELEPKIFDLPADKDLLFYCHSGARSLAAASLAAEAEVTEKTVYNLRGGLMAWESQTVSDFPRVQVFDGSKSHGELLMTAMDLEKGAWRFYRQAAKSYANQPVAETLEGLAKAETGHGRMIYAFWKKTVQNPEPFETVWDRLSGDILEGGENLDTMLGRLEHIDGNICLNLVELSLKIEYAAYDLYRTMAGKSSDSAASETFLSIAQAEKGHMRILTRAILQCENAG